ncbi:G5 domain-containing protein [Corynebacterium sp. MSK008]|uniref:G5 domain-containing protein n=1 Tax=Corynebacterium sp. MSK008 TaxID=3050188 RepID=UPI00254CDE0D|nr:G5 domain-containing protein [Corynebacterium sp. MSK008]MDK8879232.1 G5 domain-containing protein [Corynebacterium sp. MSK008]
MAESTRRFRNSTSRSIAATSAIALALGGVSVIAPGPLAPYAAAATLSGGVRDKSGAVEQDAQKASDLPAGSCVVSEANTADHSQAGFSWNTREPGTDSTDKTLWGLSVSFDNSKDRTFADWSFTNGGNLGKVLGTDNVPSMEAGQTFLDESVTHKADESIEITGSRDQRNLNLYADLTAEEVKQFASATAENPVRYAWQGNYTKDHTSGLRATQGPSSTFRAVVNPWPSENIECNPITVSWESFEKHVIVPDDETKVGTINVPPVEGDGGGKDDSMARMVVEAYDGNGKFIGTTDPEASGGTQNLRIDEDGNIFFTWPEYRGTDLATDKNVNFSVLAKPRTVNQLQAAVEHNNGGEGKAFDSSNSLDRYSKANVIDSKAFSLDDTEYHDPKYDKTDASIISGVDSETGKAFPKIEGENPPQQTVTFTQIPDLIKDLAKKKDQQGFEAKVALDEKYVYEGWTVEMDEDYNVTVTAPEEPRPGTFARPVVTVEYSNGSTDKLELLVVVDPNNTQVTDLVRPGLTKGTIGDDLTAQVGTKSIMKGHKPVHPAKFEIDESTVPEGWTVTVDETGKVTAKADDTVAPGTIITPTVKATYPDDTTDEIETQFQAIVDIKIPDYDTVTNKPNAKVTLKPEVPERGLSGNTTDEAPKRYTFADGKTEYTHTDDSGTWTVKIDENTGAITTTIPKTAPEGYVLDVPVLAYYENADEPQEVKGTVVVLKGDVAPVYDVQVTGPNKAVNHPVTGAPEGSTYSLNLEPNEEGKFITEDGWEYTIDPDTGVVSATPPKTAKPGDKKTITVTVQTPDGSRPEVPVTTVVKLTNSWESEPVIPSQTVYPGGTATSPIGVEKPEGINLAADKPFAIDPEGLEATGENNEFGNPTYKVSTANGDWIVGLDDKGNVISTAPETAKPGDKIDVPVIVTYEDGSKDNTTATVNVIDVPEREIPFKVEYKYDDTIPAGTYEVKTKGVPGKEQMKKDGTWEQTEAPKNEVVGIGTKPAESAKDVTWKFPIPYPTEVRENPELKPGEMKTVQEGENGEKTYTAKFTSKGAEAQVAEEETTKDAKPRIIEVGPGIPDQELTSKKTQEVPFEIEYVYDNTLESGKQVVDEEGVPGEQTITSSQKIKDGKPDGEPAINIEQTRAPKKAKIRIGTKTTGETTKTVESEVPFGVKVEFDPNLPAGESKVTTPGKPGKKTTTVTQKVTNSQPDGEATVEEKITEDPVDQVIKVGTKPSETSEKVEWKAPVPFEVETRPNPELKPGEVKVVQKGEPGEKTYTANFASKGDDSSVTPEEKQTKDPVKEIIEYGPIIADQTLTSTKTRELAFETEIVFDDTLPAGEQVVDQQGEKGEELITSTQEIKDGKPSGEPTISTEETKAPKKAIIRVGTKQVEPEEPAPAPSPSVEPLTVELPYPVEYTFDPNLPAGEEVVDQEGTPGAKTLRPKLEMVDGKPVWTIEEVETQKPVQRVVRVGTKQAETNPFTWTSEVPFNTIVRPSNDPNLAPGETKVIQLGENGSTKYSANPETGEVTKLEDKKPVERIVEYRPDVNDDALVTRLTRPVPFETEVVYDPNLPEGAQRIEQGEFGEEVETTTQQIKDGKPFGDPAKNTERTREPKNAVIRIGTKKTPENASVTELEVPPTTQLIFDPSLEPGEQVVVREGTPGTVRVTTVDGETTVENTLDAIPRLVRVGAKQPDQLNWLEPLPFKVIATENPDLPAGEHKVIQEGKPGLVQHVGDTATTVTEPQDYILEIGTAKDLQEKREVITEPIPFETIFVEDDTLAAGVVKVDTHGENGAKRTTKVWEMKDGQELGDPTVTDETLREPQNLIIRVGTGKPAEEKPEDPKPEQPKPETPPEDQQGSSAERCVANAFAANSPLLWLLPIGLLGAIGYGVNEMYGPQINQASGALNARWEAFVRENTPDFGRGRRGTEKPEWVRQAEAQANALNQQFNQRFAGYGEQLRPVGIALGALAAVALTGTLIAQACSEEGFDNGMTVLGSTERKLDFGASSEKADGAQAGSSSETGSSRKDGSSAK